MKLMQAGLLELGIHLQPLIVLAYLFRVQLAQAVRTGRERFCLCRKVDVAAAACDRRKCAGCDAESERASELPVHCTRLAEEGVRLAQVVAKQIRGLVHCDAM